MYLRDLPGTTLRDLREEFDQNRTTFGGTGHQIEVHLDADVPNIRLGSTEVPATKAGVDALAAHYGIPVPFINKLHPDERQWLLASRISYQADGDLTIEHDDRGIAEVYKASQVRVRPHKLLDSVLGVLPDESPIVESWLNSDEMRVDVIVPEGFDRFTGGDRQVGDITRGGVRIGQDRKNNHAPYVQPYLYRLVCTNGMEVPDLGLRVDARHATAEQIEAMFEAEIRRAVDRLESDIQSFYDLRSTELGADRTGALRRAALEQSLPDRLVGRLEDLLPSVEGENPTMFDAVNLMTNLANDPTLRRGSTTVRQLQQAGGRIVHDHGARCTSCHSRLG